MNSYEYEESNGTYHGTNDTMEHHSAISLQQIPDEGQKQAHLNRSYQQKWEVAAITLAALSVISLIILGSVSFYVSDLTNSAAAYGFGFDCFLDVGTSLVVMWRFCGTNNSHSNRKEKIALILLGTLFIVAATSVASKAIKYLINGTQMETSVGLYCLAGSATVISIILFVSKFYVARKLNSKSVLADGYSSLACGVTAFTIIISSVVFTMDSDVYYLDDIVANILAVLLLFYGIKMIVDAWSMPTYTQDTKMTVLGQQQKGYKSIE